MNTILPQFVDFNQKTAFYNDVLPIPLWAVFLLFSLIAIISIILWGVCSYYKEKRGRFLSFWEDMSMLTGILPIGLLVFFILMSFYNLDDNDKYNSSGFVIANTNLIASPHNEELEPYKNYHKADYDVYVDLVNAKPKGINEKYVVKQTPIGYPMLQTIYSGINNKREHKLINDIEDEKQSIIYLGQMKYGKFVPNYQNAKVVNIFMNYQKYIKKHHLESKFKHHFSFEVSSKVTNGRHDPVLVVIGDHGFTLYYEKDDVKKDSDIIQNT